MLASAQHAACAAAERTLFGCSSGAKTIAICASAALSATSGSLQYRFGRPGSPELAYPAAGADWRAATRAGSLMFSGGGGAYLAFTNERYRYIVYSASGRGWGNKAGVVVERAGKRIASVACKGPVASEIGPSLFSVAGIEAAEGEFDLP